MLIVGRGVSFSLLLFGIAAEKRLAKSDHAAAVKLLNDTAWSIWAETAKLLQVGQ